MIINGVSIKMTITKDDYRNGPHRDDSKRTTPDDSKRTDGYGRYLIRTCAKKIVQSCQQVHLKQNDSENHLPRSKNSQLLKKPPKTSKNHQKSFNNYQNPPYASAAAAAATAAARAAAARGSAAAEKKNHDFFYFRDFLDFSGICHILKLF